MPVSRDGDGGRGDRNAVAEVTHLSSRRIHADPTPADMPICARTIVAAGERDTFNVTRIPGTVVSGRAAEDGQAFDMDVGASEYSENGPLVFAITWAAGN